MGKRDKKRKYREPTPPPPWKFPPVKKLNSGTIFNTGMKTIILNVYKYLRIKNPDMSVSETALRTAAATGASRSSVFQFRKEEGSAEGLRNPKKKKRTKLATNSRDVKYDENVRMVIKNVVYDLKARNINANLKIILEHIKMHPDMPSLTIFTLRRLLADMGFVYKKEGNKHILVEKVIEVEKKKKPKVKKDPADPNKEKIPKKPRKPKPEAINPAFDTNMFESPQYILPPKTAEYMFYDNKQNLILHQALQQQPQQLQPQDQQQQLQQLSQSVQESQQTNTSDSLLRHMPAPILPTSIHHRDMQNTSSSKLMMLTSAQTLPWS